MEFSLVIMSALARHCSSQSVDCPEARAFSRKTADQQWDNEFIRRCRGVPWVLIGEEREVRPPPRPAG